MIFAENMFWSKVCLQFSETWVYHSEPELKRYLLEWKQTGFPVKKIFQVLQSVK